MIDVLRAEDVRRQDAEAPAHGVPVSALMRNAGFAVARAARRMLGGSYGRRVVIVCGKGNNAGDGLVAGGVLAAWGARPVAVLTTDRDALSPLAADALSRFPGAVRSLDALASELARADLVIDAVFGVGLSRPPADASAAAIREIGASRAPVLAVDVPSGVNADTGSVPGEAVRASVTVTFGGLKPGLVFMPGAAHAGAVEIADIGIPSAVAVSPVRALEAADVRAFIPVRAAGDHKRAIGTVLVVAGSRAMPGAAALTTAACVHAGAGLTTLCASDDVCAVALARTPEMTTIPVPSSPEGTLDPKALELIRPRLDEFHAVAIGPGLSTHPAAVESVRALLPEIPVPVVLDADGINAIVGATDVLRARPAPTILTPHAGELARLLDVPAAELDADRLVAAQRAVDETRAIVVFKGPGTVIADAAGATFVNTTGTAELAQGGTGDVLTGVIAALVAHATRRRSTVDARAVAAAVWLHGRAGERVAARVAPHPANASALVEELGPTIHEVFA